MIRLADHGGYLRCETCRRRAELDVSRVTRYLTYGWPRCCGYTMRWWTARQVARGEDA